MRAAEFILEGVEDTGAIYSVSQALCHRLGLDSPASYQRLQRKIKYLPGVPNVYQTRDLIDIEPLNTDRTRALYNTLSTLRIFLSRLPADNGKITHAAFLPDANAIGINTWVDWNDIPEKWPSILAHEIQHALDHEKSQGKNINLSQRDISDEQQYLAAPWEINARMQQALQLVYDTMLTLIVAHGAQSLQLLRDPGMQKKLMALSKNAMELHQLPDVFPRGLNDPGYRRLLNRVYKLVSSPVFIQAIQTRPGLVQRLAQWVTDNLFNRSGKSTNAS